MNPVEKRPEVSSAGAADTPEDIIVEEPIEPTKWTELPLSCPHCGNHGEEEGPWEINAWEPFKLIEEVVRSWIFSARLDDDGALFLVADTNSDSVD